MEDWEDKWEQSLERLEDIALALADLRERNAALEVQLENLK